MSSSRRHRLIVSSSRRFLKHFSPHNRIARHARRQRRREREGERETIIVFCHRHLSLSLFNALERRRKRSRSKLFLLFVARDFESGETRERFSRRFSFQNVVVSSRRREKGEGGDTDLRVSVRERDLRRASSSKPVKRGRERESERDF